MRTSPPDALMLNKSSFEPGTRNMSPNDVKMTSSLEAMAMDLSIISKGVTQTGQPGPCTIRTFSGSISSIPYLRIVCVCPPHTSIIVHDFLVISCILFISILAVFGSRYSSTYFIQIPFI